MLNVDFVAGNADGGRGLLGPYGYPVRVAVSDAYNGWLAAMGYAPASGNMPPILGVNGAMPQVSLVGPTIHH